MIRQKLDIHKFHRSDEIPPADHEAWIMWQFERMLLTETEAIKALAEYRRFRVRFNDDPIAQAEIASVEAALESRQKPSRIKPRTLPVAPASE